MLNTGKDAAIDRGLVQGPACDQWLPEPEVREDRYEVLMGRTNGISYLLISPNIFLLIPS